MLVFELNMLMITSALSLSSLLLIICQAKNLLSVLRRNEDKKTVGQDELNNCLWYYPTKSILTNKLNKGRKSSQSKWPTLCAAKL